MYSPAWIMQERSFNTVHNDHSSHICNNDSGVYTIYQTDTTKSEITLFKLDLNGEFIWKKTLDQTLFTSETLTSICCNDAFIYISYQINRENIIIYKINCATQNTTDINIPFNNTNKCIVSSLCCDTLYLYMVYSINNILYVYKISTDDLMLYWPIPISTYMDTDDDTYDKVFMCKNSRGIYITYLAKKNADTYINVLKIFKNNIDKIESYHAFSGIDTLINPSICCNVKNIFITYHDPLHNIHIVKCNINCEQEFKIIQENTRQYIYNLDPIICCDDKNVFLSYYTNGCTNNIKKTGTSDIVVLKVNVDGGDVITCQFVNFNTDDNDIEPSVCSDSSGIYISYTTFGTIIGSNKKSNDVDSDIAIFKLNMSTFFTMKCSTLSKVFLYKYVSHKY
jgi:hypothetical protein